MINKQKLTELLRKKECWERKRNEYCRQYHDWIDNAWLRNMALLGMVGMGGENLRREDSLSQGTGWILLVMAILLWILFIYKAFQTLPYAKKIEICKGKISKLNWQITQALEE